MNVSVYLDQLYTNDTATQFSDFVREIKVSKREFFINDSTFDKITTILDVWINLILSFFGIVANVINLIIFNKLGYKETINISLTTISVLDLIRVLSGFLHRLYGPLSLVSPGLGKTWENLTVPNLHIMNAIFGNMSQVIGAYVAIERCISIRFPFKIKGFMTPKLTLIFCVTLSVSVFVSFSPLFLIFEARWVYSSEFNYVIAVYQPTEFYKVHGDKFMPVNRYLGCVYSMLSLAVMVFSNIIISQQLQKSSTFRTVASQKFSVDKKIITPKEKQVVKMLVVLICFYIMDLIPKVGHYIAMLTEVEYFTKGNYNNVFWLVMYIMLCLDFINSSVHTFIYYTMSGKYRAKFLQVLAPPCFRQAKIKSVARLDNSGPTGY